MSETTTVRILGENYEVPEMTMKSHSALQAWVNKQPRPSPVKMELGGIMEAVGQSPLADLAPEQIEALPKDVIEKHFSETRRLASAAAQQFLRLSMAQEGTWPPEVDSLKGMNVLITSPGGATELAYQFLKPAIPDLTRQKAQEMVEKMRPREFQRLYNAAFSYLMKIEEESPKAEGDSESE